tara:strand:+ start:29738 stop:31051 length:1314 start_codon:yes stop_codon:yes gene_type:complete
MKDTEYIKILKKYDKNLAKNIKIIENQVFSHSSELDDIQSAIVKPEEFFKALSLYSSIKNENDIPPDTLAHVISVIIIKSPFICKSEIGQKWLEHFDNYYLSAIDKSPGLKDKTKITYKKTIENIQNSVWKIDDKDCKDNTLYTILHNPNLFFHKLNIYAKKTKGRISSEGRNNSTGLGEHSKDNITSPLVALFIHNQSFQRDHYDLYKKWVEHQKLLRKPIDDKYLTNEPTERQKAAFVPYEDVVKIRNNLEDGSYERLLISLYTDIPPNRSDFHDTKIYKIKPHNKDNTNYIIFNFSKNNPKGTLILNNFKTSNKYGTNIIDLPKETLTQLHLSLEKYPRDYLFISTSTQKPYNTTKHPEKNFNAWANRTLKNIFNKDFTLTMLRHIYISRRDLKLETLPGTERKIIADIMGHSLERQGMYSFFAYLNKINKDKT